MDGSLWLLVIFLIAILAPTAWLAYYLLTTDRRLRKTTQAWTYTTAKVVIALLDIKQARRGVPSYDISLTYTYETPGGNYCFERIFTVNSKESAAAGALAGHTLPLRYNPENPGDDAVFTADVKKLCRAVLSEGR